MPIKDHWSPLQVAAHQTVHKYRSGRHTGATALAPLIGKSPNVLSNEVNPDLTGHKLGFEDAVMVMNTTRDFQMLHAMALVLGFVALPTNDHSNVADMELLEQVTKFFAEIGEASMAIHESIADRRIEAHELEKIKKEGYEAIQAWYELVARLESLMEVGND